MKPVRYADRRVALIALLRGEKIPPRIACKGLRPKLASYLLDLVLEEEHLSDAILFDLELAYRDVCEDELVYALRRPKERAWRRHCANISGANATHRVGRPILDAQGFVLIYPTESTVGST